MYDHQHDRENARDYQHDPLTHRIIGSALEVHRGLGPGLLEATYERALRLELQNAGLAFVRQVTVPVLYKGVIVGEYRADLIVENKVVVEIKSVDRLVGLHEAQLLAYMRVLGLPTGLLLNFNTEVLKSGIRRKAI
jgi:GxxExxY protein